MIYIHISLGPEVVFNIGSFPVTNTLIITWVVSIILVLLAYFGTRKMKSVPKGVQFWWEVIVDEGYKFFNDITKNETVTKKIFPFIMTMFLFFLVANFIPFIPVFGAITYNHVQLNRPPTADYGFVLAIAFISVVAVQILSIKSGGIVHYIHRFINFSGKWSEKPINVFLGILDIVSEVAKVVSLSFRLFGNMFAGEVLSAVMFALLPFFAPVFFDLLGVLVRVIQAAIFAILVAIFMTMALEEGENNRKKNLNH